VTAKALGDVLRADGYVVSNVRVSALLEELRPDFEGQAPLATVSRVQGRRAPAGRGAQ
jgi:hypothetical protein